ATLPNGYNGCKYPLHQYGVAKLVATLPNGYNGCKYSLHRYGAAKLVATLPNVLPLIIVGANIPCTDMGLQNKVQLSQMSFTPSSGGCNGCKYPLHQYGVAKLVATLQKILP
ncbi:unnamed protein product, partial [Owenia fusiformis]